MNGDGDHDHDHNLGRVKSSSNIELTEATTTGLHKRTWGSVDYNGSVLKDHTRNGKGQYIHRGFNTVRHPKTSFASNPGHIWFVLRSDWFHLVVEMRSAKILLFLMVLYVTCIFFYALMWLSIGLQKDDPCETGIDNLTDAYYFSAITFTTIGYGANTVFFGSCASVPTLITVESFTGLLVHSLAMGIIFAKTQRGNTRGYSIAYSKKCLVRMIRGQPHLLFRVCEARKLQLIEAHVRLYAILDEKDPLTGEVGVASHQLRLNQPDDEMGGMLLLLLPSKVVHRIDSWSPLLPAAMRPSRGSPMQTYTFPDVRLRSADVEQGNRTGVECMITGEGFGTEDAHRLHHEREGFAYPCKGSPVHESNNGDTVPASAALNDTQQAELVRKHFEDTNLEIMVLVEGIDPTCSTTLASCYSYKIDDILFESHDYVECTSRDKTTGQVHIDFFKFHEVKPLPSTHHVNSNSDTSSCSREGGQEQQQQHVNNDSGSRRLSPPQPPQQPLLVSGGASSEGSGGDGSGGSSPARKLGVTKLGLAGMMMCMLISAAHGTAMKNQLQPVHKGAQVGSYHFSAIGCGTWSWGNKFLWGYSQDNDAELKRTYDYVTSNGCNWFDTADSYGTGALNGRAEKLLGTFEAASSINKQIGSSSNNRRRRRPIIATKLAPYPWRVGASSMVDAGTQSCRRLGRDIDVLQLHWCPPLGWQEKQYLDGFEALLDSGAASHIGLSNCGPKKLAELCAYTARSQRTRVVSNQVQFSLLSRQPLNNGLIETAKEEGVQLIGYSPLGLGLLGDKYSIEDGVLPNGVRGALFREFLPIMTPLLGELRAVAKARGKSVAQVVLNWNLSKGFLTLVGMRTVAQAKAGLGALGWRLAPSEITAIDLAAAKVPKQLVQNSFQTL